MLIRAAITAATPCQMIACVTLAKSWNSWDVSFPLRPMPHPFSNTGSRSAPTLPTIRRIRREQGDPSMGLALGASLATKVLAQRLRDEVLDAAALLDRRSAPAAG